MRKRDDIMLHIAVCDDDMKAVQMHKQIAELSVRLPRIPTVKTCFMTLPKTSFIMI